MAPILSVLRELLATVNFSVGFPAATPLREVLQRVRVLILANRSVGSL